MKQRALAIALTAWLLGAAPLSAQLRVDTSLLRFDDYAVDNDFINSKDIAHTYFGGPYNYYFLNLTELDSTVGADGKGYGVALDTRHRNIYYFDEAMRVRYFGVDRDSGATYSDRLDNVAVGDERIYVSLRFESDIYYWNRNKAAFAPVGVIGADFQAITDMTVGSSGRLYVLDGVAMEVRRYNAALDGWESFGGGAPAIDLSAFYDDSWGGAIACAAFSGGVYVIYEGGGIVKYSHNGDYLTHFWIDPVSLGLNPLAGQSRLVSADVDAYGNLYVLDYAAKLVHVFDSNLDYVASWADSNPARSMDDSVVGISVHPGGVPRLMIYHDWGFYVYRLDRRSLAVELDRFNVYPQLVNQDYPGMRISISTVGSGYLDIRLEGPQGDFVIADNRYLPQNARQTLLWNGTDVQGSAIPYGDYTLVFLVDREAKKELPVSVKAAPEATITSSRRRCSSISSP